MAECFMTSSADKAILRTNEWTHEWLQMNDCLCIVSVMAISDLFENLCKFYLILNLIITYYRLSNIDGKIN